MREATYNYVYYPGRMAYHTRTKKEALKARAYTERATGKRYRIYRYRVSNCG